MFAYIQTYLFTHIRVRASTGQSVRSCGTVCGKHIYSSIYALSCILSVLSPPSLPNSLPSSAIIIHDFPYLSDNLQNQLIRQINSWLVAPRPGAFSVEQTVMGVWPSFSSLSSGQDSVDLSSVKMALQCQPRILRACFLVAIVAGICATRAQGKWCERVTGKCVML